MPAKKRKDGVHVSSDRKFPSTSATQSPDNVAKPFWSFKDSTTPADDFFDCYVAFKDLGCHEYIWEWQGRKMDELVVKKLVTHYREFFAANPIGKDHFLTFSTRAGDVGALGRLYMSVISSNDFAASQKLFSPPLFELSHSSASPDSMLHLANLYNESVVMASEQLKHDCGPKVLSLIPHHDFLQGKWYASLNAYLGGFQNAFRCKMDYFRPFIPRATIADRLGFVSSVLATKRALASYAAFSKITGIDAHPIVEASPLLFRGGLTPFSLRSFVRNYPGARTATISPAFRYDYGVKDVKESVAALNSALPKNRAIEYSQDEIRRLAALESVFAKHHSSAVSKLPDLSYLSDAAQRAKKSVPSGLSRSFGLYSLGVPPEFIGAGKAIVECIKSGMIKDLEHFYPDIKPDLLAAGVFLNKENLSFLAKTSPAWKSILSDVNLVEDYVGDLGPSSSDSFMHRNHTSNIFHLASGGKDCSEDLLAAAKLRHCLG